MVCPNTHPEAFPLLAQVSKEASNLFMGKQVTDYEHNISAFLFKLI